MRRRRRRRGLKKTGIIAAAALLPFAAGIGVKAAPVITGIAEKIGGIKVGFDNEPEWYTGEPGFNIQSFQGEEEVISEGFGWSAEIPENDDTEDSTADAGAKPYPDEWNVSEENTVYTSSFGRYSGSKYFSLDNGGQVRNETDISNGVLLEESRLEPEFKIELNGEPQVLIMHTHTTESFEPYVREYFDPSFNYRTTDMRYNTAAVGEKICEELKKSGIGYIHDTTIHDYPSYNGSYERSAETVKKILEEYPSIKVVLDIHRDAIGTNESIMQPTVEINGKKSAQVMIISGCDDGTMDMPDYMQNFRFASLLQQQMASDYENLTRPILFDYRKYNQDLTTGSLLIEVGTHGNTLEQVEYAGELVGKSLSKALKKLS